MGLFFRALSLSLNAMVNAVNAYLQISCLNDCALHTHCHGCQFVACMVERSFFRICIRNFARDIEYSL